MTFNVNSINGLSKANRPDPAQMKAKIDALLKAGGATDEEVANLKGPQDVQTLAAKYGVNLPQPPQMQQQVSIFDNQNTIQNQNTVQAGGSRPSEPPPEIVSILQAGGATDEEIAGITGPQDAEALAAKYNITLPAPPAPPQGLQGKSIFDQK